MAIQSDKRGEKTMDEKKCCEKCCWWLEDEIGAGGDCHRFPMSFFANLFRWAPSSHLCGEFKLMERC